MKTDVSRSWIVTMTIASKNWGGLILLPFILLVAVPARGADYSDGGTHTISGADSNVAISNGTTVNVVPGATITGVDIDPFNGLPAMTVDGTSVLNVTGGSITGGHGSYQGSAGLRAGGQIDISGGSFVGGSATTFLENRFAGPAADISGFQSLSISGGNFTGGLGWNAGAGMRIGSYLSTAFISGGDFYGGDSPDGHLYGDGLAIYNRPAASWSAVISGGNFHGGWGPPPLQHPGLHLVNAAVDATGGDAGATLLDGSIMNVSDGFNAGALIMYGNSILTLNSGYINFPDFHDTSVLNMNGGFMTGGGWFYDNSVVNVRGGHFGRLDSPNLASQQAILNVYGRGLTYQNNELHGILEDGTPLDATIWLYDNAVINLYQVPEPSSFVLAAVGLIGLVVRRRRKR
jgi:hypothetical protein